MRLLILSDLHHELWREKAPHIDSKISRPDMVVLAGDISGGAKAVEWAANAFADSPVLYVSGNHEAYGKILEDVQDDIEIACLTVPNVHFLNCSEYIQGSVRFLGATLWTDFKLFGDGTRADAMREAESAMTDYKRIRLAKKGYRKLRAADTAQLHAVQKDWIKKKLAEPFAGITVVITHMARRCSRCQSNIGPICPLHHTPRRWTTWSRKAISGYTATCMKRWTTESENVGSSVIRAAISTATAPLRIRNLILIL
jgi:3',5'-cyclic AMP phosphodiesterase CpdA